MILFIDLKIYLSHFKNTVYNHELISVVSLKNSLVLFALNAFSRTPIFLSQSTFCKWPQ